MDEPTAIYFAIVPIVLAAATAEGLWLSRTRPQGYDWKAAACSVVDLIGRRLLAFIPLTLVAPWMAWA